MVLVKRKPKPDSMAVIITMGEDMGFPSCVII
jgi:hypothetical protein